MKYRVLGAVVFQLGGAGYKIRKIDHYTFESLAGPEGLKLSGPGSGGRFRPPRSQWFLADWKMNLS